MTALVLSIVKALYLQHFEKSAIVTTKTNNEYCQYLLAAWDYSHTPTIEQDRTPLQSTYATGRDDLTLPGRSGVLA